MKTRRDFMATGGALVVGLTLRDTLFAQAPSAAGARSLDVKQVDTWLAIHADNTATIYIGFAELGQGASTALLQVAAEELDLDMDQVRSVQLDTTVTPNQGGTYSSAAINRGSPQIRAAAAEARQALLQLASKALEAPVDRLTVSKGTVSVVGDDASKSPTGDVNRSVKYGALVGDKPFNLAVTGSAPVKTPGQYTLVGTPVSRNDVPAKVGGTFVYMQHVRVPGMVHGRVVRPRGQSAYGAGAKMLSLDEASIRSIPGARVLRRGDFVGVVAESEWDAVRAARQLRIAWDIRPVLPGADRLHEQMRSAQTQDRVVLERGDVAAALGTAPHVVTQIGRGPYQAHAAFSPNCALADVKADSALVISTTQDIYGTRTSLARVLGMPAERIQVRYQEGASVYGHGCQDDAAQAAAIMSQLAGKPVRVQFMRWDEHGWDNYGPAHLGEVRAAADAEGRIVAYEYQGWQHNWINVETSAQLTGIPAAEREGSAAQQVSPLNLGSMYDVANLRLVNHRVPGMDYLKGAWLRSPLDLSFSFASEQAIDELAYLLKTGSLLVPAAQYQGCPMARRPRCGGGSGKVDTAARGVEPVECEDRHRPRHWRRHASGVIWRRRRGDRSEQADGPHHRETHVRSDRCGPRGESRQHREPDQRPIGPDGQPDAEGGSDVQPDQCHKPGLEYLPDSSFRRVPRGHSNRRPAAE